MRLSDRTDVFSEKFARRSSRELPAEIAISNLNGAASASSSKLNGSYEVVGEALTRSKSTTSLKQHQRSGSSTSADPPSEVSHNSSGSVVWVGDESQPESLGDAGLSVNTSADALRSRDDLLTVSSDSGHFAKRRITQRDTHFYETSVKYANIPLPIKIPVSAFAEEVGDVSPGPHYVGNIVANKKSVLIEYTYQDLLTPASDHCWATSSSSTFQWLTNSSNHSHIQCHYHAKTGYFYRPSKASIRCRELCSCCMCTSLWQWLFSSRVYRACISLRQS